MGSGEVLMLRRMNGVYPRWIQIALLFCVAMTPTANAQKVVVQGELTFSYYGVAVLRECVTQRQFEFGAMDATPYFSFLKQYDRISGPEKRTVLADVEGEFGLTSEGRLVLTGPRIVSITQGQCKR
jgi:hypothetical protein